jgi:hypothetical protein
MPCHQQRQRKGDNDSNDEAAQKHVRENVLTVAKREEIPYQARYDGNLSETLIL